MRRNGQRAMAVAVASRAAWGVANNRARVQIAEIAGRTYTSRSISWARCGNSKGWTPPTVDHRSLASRCNQSTPICRRNPTWS
jgi:hypothetical protein